MRKMLFICMITCMVYAGVEIPKSSLEHIKNDIIRRLETAQKEHDQKLEEKYQKELAHVEQKIKKFECEWLEYRKNQLKAKPITDAVKNEMDEIDILIKARS